MGKGYTVIQAAKDYQQRGDVVIIRIVLVLPANYPTSQPDAAATACDNTALEQRNLTVLWPESDDSSA